MTTAEVGDLLVYVAVPGATLFPILYMWAAPWSKSTVGRAIVTSKIGLALLVDLSLVYRFLGPDYPGHDQAVLAAFALIVVGTYLYLLALVREQLGKRRRKP